MVLLNLIDTRMDCCDMVPEFKTLPETRLVGLCIETSLSAKQTASLWQAFMPRRHEIDARVSEQFWSVQIFPAGLTLAEFTPMTRFHKWAAVPVGDVSSLPPTMEQLVIPVGLYAVFAYQGDATNAQQFMQWIFGHWLPQSGYALDARPQFEIMDADYQPQDPQAREEIWIPVVASGV